MGLWPGPAVPAGRAVQAVRRLAAAVADRPRRCSTPRSRWPRTCSCADRAPRPIALVSWLAVICEMAEPRSADPFPPALLGVLLAVRLVTPVAAGGARPRGRLVGAALLTAVAAAFRLDFALYGGAAVVFALAASGELRSRRRREWARPGRAVRRSSRSSSAPSIYAPFAIADGVGHLYQALIGTSLRTGGNWTLPFPLHFHAPAGAGLAKTAEEGAGLLRAAVIVLVGFALTAIAALSPSSAPLARAPASDRRHAAAGGPAVRPGRPRHRPARLPALAHRRVPRPAAVRRRRDRAGPDRRRRRRGRPALRRRRCCWRCCSSTASPTGCRR